MSRQRSFTLIELLVTIAIIAILASILFPGLSKARARVKTVACANNVRTLVSCSHMYTTDFNGWLPPRAVMNAATTHQTWWRLFPYLKYYQPNPNIGAGPGQIRRNADCKTLSWCPGISWHDESTYGPDYGINGMLGVGCSSDGTVSSFDRYSSCWNRIDGHPGYSKLVLFADTSGDGWGFNYWAFPDYLSNMIRWRHNTSASMEKSFGSSGVGYVNVCGDANMGFVDGSVKSRAYRGTDLAALRTLIRRPQGPDMP